MTIGYVYEKQRFCTPEEQERMIRACAKRYRLGELKIKKVSAEESIKAQNIKKSETIVIANVSLLGERFEEIVKAIKELSGQKIRIFSAKEDLQIDTSYPQMLSESLETLLKIYKGIFSLRNRQIQAVLQEQGKPRGCGHNARKGTSVLDGREKEIAQYLKRGLSFAKIAEAIGVSCTTVFMFVKKKGLGMS